MKSFVDRSQAIRRQQSDQAVKSSRSAGATRQLMDNRSEALSQRMMSQAIHNGPQQAAQRRLIDGLQGQSPQAHTSAENPLLQRMEAEEEELLQGRFQTAQRQSVEDEELLQGRFETTQREALEEEEPLQGKFEAVQRKELEDDELLQGKFGAQPVQRAGEERPNHNGLPDNLKAGIETLSGYSMDDVKVHYNSPQPAQIQAHAYAQGNDIHLASGQEKHLPHEAWHVVQQKQGRVKPTLQMKTGITVNDDPQLEKEADVMGMRAGGVQRKEIARLKSESISSYDKKAAQLQLIANTARPATIQRYRTTLDGQFHVSENDEFAVSTVAYPQTIYVQERAPIELPGGLKWNVTGMQEIDDNEYTAHEADISEYEAETKPGTEQYCGEFARGLTGYVQNEEQSTADPGGTLYYADTSPGLDEGWENHYAAVVIRDGGDHGTFETAVGIPHVWAGIYGTQRGQTFKYKTQLANIDRLEAMEDAVIPARYGIYKTFWDYIFCRPGTRVITDPEVRIPRGITTEQGVQWRNEMEAWRKNGTEPESAYMRSVVKKLKVELDSFD